MTRFTRDEQRTMMTLWSIFRSPLMFGGELRDNDAWTQGLLTNREVLAVHRDGRHPRPVTVGGERRIWVSEAGDGLNVALFNLSDEPAELAVTWAELGLAGTRRIRDRWEGRELDAAAGWKITLPAHGSTLALVR
jgi:hypothetical protein